LALPEGMRSTTGLPGTGCLEEGLRELPETEMRKFLVKDIEPAIKEALEWAAKSQDNEIQLKEEQLGGHRPIYLEQILKGAEAKRQAAEAKHAEILARPSSNGSRRLAAMKPKVGGWTKKELAEVLKEGLHGAGVEQLDGNHAVVNYFWNKETILAPVGGKSEYDRMEKESIRLMTKELMARPEKVIAVSTHYGVVDAVLGHGCPNCALVETILDTQTGEYREVKQYSCPLRQESW
jgi:hypothetical protein